MDAEYRKKDLDGDGKVTPWELRGQMWQRGAEIAYLPARGLREMVRADSARWARIAQATGARAE